MPDQAGREPDEQEPVAPGTLVAPRRRIDPALLGYLIGPAALVTILVLMHFGFVVHVSPWTWMAIFIAIPLANLVVDRAYAEQPSRVTFHARVAVQVTTVTVVIYLTGWGPVR